MSRVLAFGCTHAPCMHPDFVQFLRETYDQWKCDTLVHLGDWVDWAGISFHDRLPQFPGAVDEYHMAKEQVRTLDYTFRDCVNKWWLIGNHDCRPARLGSTVGIPDFLLRSEQEIWDVPAWEVVPRYGFIEVDGVLYQHGEKGLGGQRSAQKNSQAQFKSMVQAHWHSQCLTEWYCNEKHRIFGMQVGCGIEISKWAFEYSRRENKRPILGCGVILHGTHAFNEVMEL